MAADHVNNSVSAADKFNRRMTDYDKDLDAWMHRKNGKDDNRTGEK